MIREKLINIHGYYIFSTQGIFIPLHLFRSCHGLIQPIRYMKHGFIYSSLLKCQNINMLKALLICFWNKLINCIIVFIPTHMLYFTFCFFFLIKWLTSPIRHANRYTVCKTEWKRNLEVSARVFFFES